MKKYVFLFISLNIMFITYSQDYNDFCGFPINIGNNLDQNINNAIYLNESKKIYLFGKSDNEAMITCLNYHSDILWTKIYSNIINNEFVSAAISSNKDALLILSRHNTSINQSTITKVDLNGNLIWSKNYDIVQLKTSQIFEIGNDNYLVLGGRDSGPNNTYYKNIIDGNGNLISSIDIQNNSTFQVSSWSLSGTKYFAVGRDGGSFYYGFGDILGNAPPIFKGILTTSVSQRLAGSYNNVHYLCTNHLSGTQRHPALVAFDNSMNILWSFELSNFNTSEWNVDFEIDKANGDLYIRASDIDDSNKSTIFRFDSNGNILNSAKFIIPGDIFFHEIINGSFLYSQNTSNALNPSSGNDIQIGVLDSTLTDSCILEQFPNPIKTNLVWNPTNKPIVTANISPNITNSGSIENIINYENNFVCDSCLDNSQNDCSIGLDFDGINDYINIDVIQTEMVLNSQFTIEFRVQIDGVNSNNYGTLFASNSSSGANKIDIYYDYPTGVIKVLNTNISNIYLTGSSFVGDNDCHHIAYVFDNDSTFLYVDGILETSNLSSLSLNSSDKYSIGQEYDAGLIPSDFYEDIIDDMRIWNYRRSITEIQDNKDLELTGNEPGLIAYYDFNHGIPGGNNIGIISLEDKTTNGYNGTLNNFSLTSNSSNWICKNCVTLDSNCSNSSNFIEICDGDSVQISLPNGTNYLWNPNYNITENSIQNPYLYPNINSEYLVSYQNEKNCDIIDTVKILVNTKPEITISPKDSSINTGTCITLSANGGNSYIWTPSTGLDNPNIANPTVCPTNSIEYKVEVTDSLGCISEEYVNILVKQKIDCIIMPTAFSPNNDNVNDDLYPISLFNETEINSFRIYNRWGEEIHNSLNPWDGTYKGVKQNLEVYVYYVDYFCNDEKKSIFGNISLIR